MIHQEPIRRLPPALSGRVRETFQRVPRRLTRAELEARKAMLKEQARQLEDESGLRSKVEGLTSQGEHG